MDKFGQHDARRWFGVSSGNDHGMGLQGVQDNSQ